MNTSENAPRTCGSSSIAAASMVRSACAAISAERVSVSLVDAIRVPSGSSPDDSARSASRARSSWVLVMLPLWPSARWPVAVCRNVGWAFSHTLEPVVE